MDYNGDGIPDDSEVDDTVDLNEDGTPDNDQPDVIKSARSALAGKQPMGVSKDSTYVNSIKLLEPIHPSEVLDKKNKPRSFKFGLACYRLKVNQPGDTVLVRIYYAEDISDVNQYYIYDTVNGWQDYTQYTTFNQDGRSMTVELQDGAHGDSDGVANGIIVDPGGVVGNVSAGGLDPGAASSACFIATAAFGSYMEPDVMLLREFRDQYLLTNKPGKRFVKAYYKYGPHAANYVEEHDWLKPIVRVSLMPLVGISYILVRTSLATVIPSGGLLLIFSVLSYNMLVYRRRKYQT